MTHRARGSQERRYLGTPSVFPSVLDAGSFAAISI